MNCARSLSSAALLLALAAAARADSLTIGNEKYTGTINGIKDGKVSLTRDNTEHLYDLSQVQSINLDAVPKLAAAEQERTTNPLDASELYSHMIRTINNPEVKILVELRAVEPYEKNNQFDAAVALFLDVYQSHPDDAVWRFHPTQFPAQGSKMLATATAAVNAAIPSAKTVDARRNLQLFLLDILTRAGDTDAAARLAESLKTGISEKPAMGAPAISPERAATLEKIDSELQARQFLQALQNADAALATAPPPPADAAVQLFSQKARALEALNKPEDAAAAWLRIPAHFPTSPAVPAALLHAATLEESLHHDGSATALIQELKTSYPASPEAAAAKIAAENQ